ncbi:MAG: hypothetical protein QOF48_1188 [Verrucomicrobiota bacterium]
MLEHEELAAAEDVRTPLRNSLWRAGDGWDPRSADWLSAVSPVGNRQEV